MGRLFSFFVLWILLLTVGGCKKTAVKSSSPPIPVSVVTIEEKNIPAFFEYVGVINSSHEVEIRARVTGYIDEIAYVEGAFVNKGDLLFQLDPRPFQAVLAQEKAQVEREKAVLWQAERSVARFKPLYEQKAASQRDLDNAIASQMSAEAQVLSAQAKVAEAEINLNYTTITSPVSGLSTFAKYRVGALISPSQDLLTTISVMDPIWVDFSVSEQDMLMSKDQLSKGRLIFPKDNLFEVELILADGSIFPQKGFVNFSSPTYSEKTGTMMIRAVIRNPNSFLRPGQFVRVRVLGAMRPNAMAVPQRAVIQSKQGTFVFVVDEGDKVRMQLVEPGPWNGNDWIIYGGVKNGDKVIVDGVNKVLPGALVKILPNAPKE